MSFDFGEAELHSLRLRLDAGRLSKAKRGELVHHLPTGLVRDRDGQVHFDPDTSVQARIRLVFCKFQELLSAQKVLRYLAKHGLKLPRRHAAGLHAGEMLWKEPSISAVHGILKNPAYAGAFAYGREDDGMVQIRIVWCGGLVVGDSVAPDALVSMNFLLLRRGGRQLIARRVSPGTETAPRPAPSPVTPPP